MMPGGDRDDYFGYGVLSPGRGRAQALILAQDLAGGAYSDDQFVRRWKEVRARFPGLLGGDSDSVSDSDSDSDSVSDSDSGAGGGGGGSYGGEFDGLSASGPAHLFAFWWGNAFKWPRPAPITPMTHPTVTGVILGQLRDPATPYKWAQETKAAFPAMSLVTSQDAHHGVAADGTDANLAGTGKLRLQRSGSMHNGGSGGGSGGGGSCWDHVAGYLFDDVQVRNGVTCRTPLPWLG
jgi:hypothetical protein